MCNRGQNGGREGAGPKRPVCLAGGKKGLVGRWTHLEHMEIWEVTGHSEKIHVLPHTQSWYNPKGTKKKLALHFCSLLAMWDLLSGGAVTCPLRGPCGFSSHVAHGLQEGVSLFPPEWTHWPVHLRDLAATVAAWPMSVQAPAHGFQEGAWGGSAARNKLSYLDGCLVAACGYQSMVL